MASFQISPPVTEPLIRVLAEFAALSLPEDRLATLGETLKDILATQALLAAVDVSEVEPESSFDPRWE